MTQFESARDSRKVFYFAFFQRRLFMPICDLSAGVDDDGAAFGAVEWLFAEEQVVGLAHFAAGVGEEVVGDFVLSLECCMAEGAVGGDAEDDGPAIGRDRAELRSEGTVLLRADGAEIH